MPPDVPTLAGWTVGITAERRREELGSALQRHGATVVYGPAIRVVPLADDTQLLDATKRCLAAPLDVVVATTGVGFRGWLDAAPDWGLGETLLDALHGATILTRGPKVRGVVRAAGLREAWSPESESSDEVLEHLLTAGSLTGRRIAVQLHGDPMREMVDALRNAGAEVIEVPVYRWEPPADPTPLHQLLALTAEHGVDAVTFTSAPAATSFLQTADELGLGPAVRAALRGPVLCIAVGPVTGAPLAAAQLPVISPDRFRLGALVREVVSRLPARTALVHAAGRQLEIRGRAVLVDAELRPLPAASMAALRLLAAEPGRVRSDAQLTDVVVAQLRSDLGDPAIVQTTGAGHRLAVDP